MMTQILPVETHSYDKLHSRKVSLKTCPPRHNLAREKEVALQNLRKTEGNRLQVLSSEQVERLHEVMCQSIPVRSRNPDYPTINICLKEFVKAVKERLREDEVEISDIRLNGTTASYIIGNEYVSTYNDIDFLFGVNFSSQQSGNINKVKAATLDALISFLPSDKKASDITKTTSFQESYISKLFRMVSDAPKADRWSLIGLGNTELDPASTVVAKAIEIKFVDRMKRSYEFTVDSFQIILDSLLTFYEVTTVPMSEHFYPTVVADSVAGSFQDALEHLRNRIIYTKNPEEIRGGGLLKYCRLLLEGYQSSPEIEIRQLEKYMCSRFFIDFPDIQSQQGRLISYLNCHFCGQNEKKIIYLDILQNVIWTSTVCLMNHERYQTLRLIENLILDIRNWEMGQKQSQQSVNSSSSIMKSTQAPLQEICLNYDSNNAGCFIKQEDIGANDWILDEVVYGTQCFPKVPNHSVGASSISSSMYTSPGELSPTSSMGLADSQSTYSSMLDGLSYTSSVCPSPAVMPYGALPHMVYPQSYMPQCSSHLLTPSWPYPAIPASYQVDYCYPSASVMESIPSYHSYVYPSGTFEVMPPFPTPLIVPEGAGPPL